MIDRAPTHALPPCVEPPLLFSLFHVPVSRVSLYHNDYEGEVRALPAAERFICLGWMGRFVL